MSNQFFNFYYDPVRQGYDLDTWSTLTGAPVVVSNELKLQSASIIHFADILHGSAAFDVKIPTPIAGSASKFGFYDLNQLSGIGFTVTDTVLSAECYTPSKNTTTAITFNSSWNNTNTSYQIDWEAGRVSFKINGQTLVEVSDISVPGNPLNLYLISTSVGALYLNYINVKGVENMIWN